MSTAVSICSNALRLIGADSITLLSESTDRARLCNAFYAPTRDSCLREHPWNFSIVRDTLSPEVSGPESQYTYQYVLPTDPYCLRVLRVNDDDAENWVVEGRKLLTNEGTCVLKYISQVDDPADFDPVFTEALEYRLASKLAYPLIKKREVAIDMLKLYDMIIHRARAQNLIENRDEEDVLTSNPLRIVR